jgi:hypothetical protein
VGDVDEPVDEVWLWVIPVKSLIADGGWDADPGDEPRGGQNVDGEVNSILGSVAHFLLL